MESKPASSNRDRAISFMTPLTPDEAAARLRQLGEKKYSSGLQMQAKDGGYRFELYYGQIPIRPTRIVGTLNAANPAAASTDVHAEGRLSWQTFVLGALFGLGVALMCRESRLSWSQEAELVCFGAGIFIIGPLLGLMFVTTLERNLLRAVQTALTEPPSSDAQSS